MLLVQKTKPEWQAGLLNGVGGKVEPDEVPLSCMIREFREETGLQESGWDLFAIESGPDYMTYFYRANLNYMTTENARAAAISVPSHNDANEPLIWKHVDDLVHEVRQVGNLRWLIPMALDWRKLVAKVETTDDIKTRASW